MFSTLAITGAHFAGHSGGFHVAFVLIPLFWLAVIALLVVLMSRARRRAALNGHYGHFASGHAPWAASAARSAESTLAERFAQGDIDEKEYRARLEVLRANAYPASPMK